MKGSPRLSLTAILQLFLGEEIALRAAALTYISVLSLAPLATIAFQLLASVHQDLLRVHLHAFLTDTLAPGMRQDSATFLDTTLRSAGSRPLGWVSFGLVLLTGSSLLKNLDAALNRLWGIHERRPLRHRLLLYLVAMTTGPLLLAVSLVSSSRVGSLLVVAHLPKVGLALGGFVSPMVGLALLYRFAPRARVKALAALLCAVVAGTAWSVAKWGYAVFAARIFHYNLVYGSLGAVPLFLTWVYVSWLIVLSGGRLGYAIQQHLPPRVPHERPKSVEFPVT